MARKSETTEAVPAGVSDRWEPYPFAYKARQYAGYTDEALSFARHDASDAAAALRGLEPNSRGLCPSTWYTDDAATIAAEIERRRVGARVKRK